MRRLLWVATGLVVKLGALLAAKAVLMLSVAAISLAVSMASFAIPALANAIWSATAFVSRTVVAPPRETERLRHETQSLRRANQDLTESNRRLADRNRDLTRRTDTLTERNRDLQRENRRAVQASRVNTTDSRRLGSSNAELRSRISGMRTAATQGARRIGQRAVQTTTRSVAAIPIESVPILGVSTILATTAWEIRDVCRTLDDMAEIQRALGDTPDTGFAERACDMAPLWRERGDHYGDMTISECREKAEEARDRVFDLAAEARDEVPELITEADDFDDEVREAAEAEREAVLEICDCIVDLDCDPTELAKR